jgi:hypothetical protein
MRMETIFAKMIVDMKDIDSTAYFKMKKIYVDEFNKNLIKLKVLAKIKSSNKK